MIVSELMLLSIAPREIREDRLLLRLRTNLVQDRTRVMNRVHSLLDKYDVKCAYDNIFGVKGTRWLRCLKLSDNDEILLHEYVTQIEFLNTEIQNIESKIICEASKNESVKILMSMTGIDYFSAMMILLIHLCRMYHIVSSICTMFLSRLQTRCEHPIQSYLNVQAQLSFCTYFLLYPLVITLQDWSVNYVRKLKCQPCMEAARLMNLRN